MWLPLTGHGQSPTPEETARFLKVVADFRAVSVKSILFLYLLLSVEEEVSQFTDVQESLAVKCFSDEIYREIIFT